MRNQASRVDFIFGIGVGLVAALIIVGIALYLLLRDTAPSITEPKPGTSNPAVTVLLVESFLNQQLRDALAREAAASQAETAVSPNAPGPFKIKLNDAALNLQPSSRAQFLAHITASAWNFSINVRPAADFYFAPQDGRVKIIVQQVRLGTLTIPRALIDNFVNEVVETAQAKLNHSLAQLQRDTNVALSEIETTEDLLILKFN